jgi:hypothetical protein
MLLDGVGFEDPAVLDERIARWRSGGARNQLHESIWW